MTFLSCEGRPKLRYSQACRQRSKFQSVVVILSYDSPSDFLPTASVGSSVVAATKKQTVLIQDGTLPCKDQTSFRTSKDR